MHELDVVRPARSDASPAGRSRSSSTVRLTWGFGWTGSTNWRSGNRSASPRIAPQADRSGAPKLSRRWVVTSTRRRCRIQRRERRRPEPVVRPHRLQQRVDHRVAGQVDVAGGMPSASSASRAAARGREVQRGDPGGEHPVHLLGKRLPAVARAESGLDVPRGHPLEERGEGRGERRGRVALDQHDVGPHPAQQRRQPIQDARRDARRRSVPAPSGRGRCRPEVEHLEHLVEHAAVLRRHAHEAFEAVRRRPRARGPPAPS